MAGRARRAKISARCPPSEAFTSGEPRPPPEQPPAPIKPLTILRSGSADALANIDAILSRKLKRERPFQLPSIIRRRKKARGASNEADTASSARRACSAPSSPVAPRALFCSPSDACSRDSWSSHAGRLEDSGASECDSSPLSTELVDTPELGEYSSLTWRAFANMLNEMDCRALGRFSDRSEHHAVAVSLAMGLQGVEYCFSGCEWCHSIREVVPLCT
eukprot:jgi/Mesvir1/6943/Mv24247-RA.1